jgi:hypothetical protein
MIHTFIKQRKTALLFDENQLLLSSAETYPENELFPLTILLHYPHLWFVPILLKYCYQEFSCI